MIADAVRELILPALPQATAYYAADGSALVVDDGDDGPYFISVWADEDDIIHMTSSTGDPWEYWIAWEGDR